jgi:hypothetical protein
MRTGKRSKGKDVYKGKEPIGKLSKARRKNVSCSRSEQKISTSRGILGQTKITQFEITHKVYENISGFKVAVNNVAT